MRGMNAVVQRLAGSEAGQVLRHLQALSPEDRTLRFGAAANDAALERYVDSIDFTRDTVFGLFEPEAALLGVAHLALGRDGAAAELGLSVTQQRRGAGYGYALLSISASHAGRLGLRRLYLHCLAENSVMIHLARKAGMTVVREHAEAGAHLALQPQAPHGASSGMRLVEWLAIMRGAWRQPRQA
jgi:RimJ/RimL family protein N-acetyltransferase